MHPGDFGPPGDHQGLGEPARQSPGTSPSLDPGVLDGAQSCSAPSSPEQGERTSGPLEQSLANCLERLCPLLRTPLAPFAPRRGISQASPL